jgi:hypothetical protein
LIPADKPSSRLIDTALFNVGIMRVFIPAAASGRFSLYRLIDTPY